MNEVLKNTHTFVEVLKMAKCEAVERWDEAALHRAYKWAQYFEEVHCKLKTKPLLAEKLDNYLLNFRKSTSIYLGDLHPSFEMLQHSKDILRQCLLQNPHLSQKLHEVTLQLYGLEVGETLTDSNLETLLKDAVTLSQSKAAAQILSKMKECLALDLKQVPVLNLEGRTSTRAINRKDSKQPNKEMHGSREVTVKAAVLCLFLHIQHHLQYGDEEEKQSLYRKLVELASQDCGLSTIITLLSQTPDDYQPDSHADVVTQFVLEWLVGFISDDNYVRLLELPPVLLTQVSSMYISFFKVYLSQLISWGNNMVPSVTSSGDKEEALITWRFNTDTKANTLNFEHLLCHMKNLSSGPVYIAEITTKALQSLAIEKSSCKFGITDIENGRHNLLGVNIWQELLVSLNTE